MKNLGDILPFLKLKIITFKYSKKTSFIKEVNSVHRRRDLDSLGEFINF